MRSDEPTAEQLPPGARVFGRGDGLAEAAALPVDPDIGPDGDAGHPAAAGPFDGGRPRGWPRLRPAVLAAVFTGGLVGGLARYEVTRVWPAPTRGFPWATFAINTSGAFLLALLLVLVVEVLPPTTFVRPLLGTGFCGAWTTFSSVVATTDQLVAHGAPAVGVGYLLASVLAGLAGAALGLVSGRAVGAFRHRQDATGGRG